VRNTDLVDETEVGLNLGHALPGQTTVLRTQKTVVAIPAIPAAAVVAAHLLVALGVTYAKPVIAPEGRRALAAAPAAQVVAALPALAIGQSITTAPFMADPADAAGSPGRLGQPGNGGLVRVAHLAGVLRIGHALRNTDFVDETEEGFDEDVALPALADITGAPDAVVTLTAAPAAAVGPTLLRPASRLAGTRLAHAVGTMEVLGAFTAASPTAVIPTLLPEALGDALALALHATETLGALAAASPTAVVTAFQAGAVGETAVLGAAQGILLDVVTRIEAKAVPAIAAVHRAGGVGFRLLALAVSAGSLAVLVTVLPILLGLAQPVTATLRVAVFGAEGGVLSIEATAVAAGRVEAVLHAGVLVLAALAAPADGITAGAATIGGAGLRPFPRVAHAVAAGSAIRGTGALPVQPVFATVGQVTVAIAAQAAVFGTGILARLVLSAGGGADGIAAELGPAAVLLAVVTRLPAGLTVAKGIAAGPGAAVTGAVEDRLRTPLLLLVAGVVATQATVLGTAHFVLGTCALLRADVIAALRVETAVLGAALLVLATIGNTVPVAAVGLAAVNRGPVVLLDVGPGGGVLLTANIQLGRHEKVVLTLGNGALHPEDLLHITPCEAEGDSDQSRQKKSAAYHELLPGTLMCVANTLVSILAVRMTNQL